MSAHLYKSLGLLLILSLLLAACQPIQPIQPAELVAAEGGTVPAPAMVERYFPVPGITVSLPEEWIYRYETVVPLVEAWSAAPPPEQRNGVMHWRHLLEEPIAGIMFSSHPLPAGLETDLGKLLTSQSTSGGTSWSMMFPEGTTTVVEGPTLLTINGQPAARIVVEGTDAVLQEPFRLYAFAIRNGNRMVYVSSALLEENEAAFVPFVDQIAESVLVSEPQAEPKQAPEATGEIAPGMIVTGTLRLSPPDQILRDYWHFAAKGGKRYVAIVTPGEAYTDIAATIMNEAGASRAGSEVFDNKGQPATVEIKPRQDGDYYIAIRNWMMDDGTYTVELQETD